MRGRVRAVVLGCAALGALGVATVCERADAAPALQSFSVDYSAPQGCPARATFVASILARAPESREVSLEENPELAFNVRIEPEAELTRGTLVVRFAHGEHFAREVPASRCADVTTTMAIMAGLLLSGALLPEPAPEPAPPAVASPAPSSAAARPTAPVSPSARRPEPQPPAPPARDERSARHAFAQVRAGAFASEALDWGALPFPALGVNAGFELALERPSVVAPSLRTGFAYFASKASRAPTGDGLFVLRALALRACPFRFELGAPVAVHACALFDAGRLTVSGRNTTNPLERHMIWLAAGPAGRAEARLGRVVSLELEASVFGLVHHDEFVLEPADVKLHKIPAVGGQVTLGVVARLP